ncbi:uncharacterized protein LOC144153405 [Haemaphysalis longicornis]
MSSKGPQAPPPAGPRTVGAETKQGPQRAPKASKALATQSGSSSTTAKSASSTQSKASCKSSAEEKKTPCAAPKVVTGGLKPRATHVEPPVGMQTSVRPQLPPKKTAQPEPPDGTLEPTRPGTSSRKTIRPEQQDGAQASLPQGPPRESATAPPPPPVRRRTTKRSDMEETASQAAKTREYTEGKGALKHGLPEKAAPVATSAGTKASRKDTAAETLRSSPPSPVATATQRERPHDSTRSLNRGQSFRKDTIRSTASRALLNLTGMVRRKSVNIARWATGHKSPTLVRETKPNSTNEAAPDKAPVSVPRKVVHEEEEGGQSELNSQQQRFLALGGALSLTVLLIILFSVVAYFIRSSGGVVLVACETPQCIAAKRYLDGLTDSKHDRCADFYQYVCHSWEGKKSSFEQDQQNALAEKLDAHFAPYDVRRADELGTHVAATIYNGCNDFLGSLNPPSSDSYEAARTTIMTTQLRKAANFAAIIQILVRVSLELGLYTVIAIEVIHLNQGDRKGQASLHFSPGKSLLRKLGHTSHEELTRSMPRLYAWLEELCV